MHVFTSLHSRCKLTILTHTHTMIMIMIMRKTTTLALISYQLARASLLCKTKKAPNDHPDVQNNIISHVPNNIISLSLSLYIFVFAKAKPLSLSHTHRSSYQLVL